MSTQSNLNYRCDGVWLALLLALIITGSLRADEGRWLIVVENSAAMKSRLPSVDTVLKNLVMSDFGGNLRAGDSVGVWTFSDSLVTGKFPLTTWDPALAPGFMTNLLGYVDRLNYSGSPKFASLQPRLDQVIANSERLSVIILCSGTDSIHWTPYDDGLNDTLKQMADERKKLKQPFVLVLRTQQGKYAGATLNFPPQPANFPPFPKLPRELKAAAEKAAVQAAQAAAAATAVKTTNPPPLMVPAGAPPLIIVGTKVSTNVHDVPKVTVVSSNPPALVAMASNNPAMTLETVSNPIPVKNPSTNPALTQAAGTNPAMVTVKAAVSDTNTLAVGLLD
ncbi:MAG TPA: hypothetical protein VF607_10880, partial [Verrucomicrobiae bacterium]